MKSSISSEGQVQQGQINDGLKVEKLGIVYGYLNYETFNPVTGKWSLSVNAMTIIVTENMMLHKFNVSTDQVDNIKAILNCCIKGKVEDGTVLEEGETVNPFNPMEKIKFRRVWRKNTREGNVSRKPTWTLPED